MQNLNIVLDVSSIIWDEVDYNENKSEYYNLVDGFTNFLSVIENEKPKVLLSSTLQTNMMADFPFGKPPYYNSTFEKQTLSFLSRVETVEFPISSLPFPTSHPDLMKGYYSDSIKTEIGLLVSKIHSDDENRSKYFTFNYLWKENDQLKTETTDKTNTYETIIADNGSDLDTFFAKFIVQFEHNPKHDKKLTNTKEKWLISDDQDGFISRLSCYNGTDDNRPNEILNKRYPNLIDNCYYGYDDDINSEVFIVFRRTHVDKNIFHGYDENNPNRIPSKVRKHFNK